MGSLAGLLKARGFLVTGSDDELYPPMSTALEDWGIPVFSGFSADHLESDAGQPDCVVIGNAVRADNPEARAALARAERSDLAVLSFPDALFAYGLEGRHRVVVSGTHGKTTTTSLLASILTACGRDPSVLVGGISLDLGGSFRDGAGPHFVVEGDEYDTAFFDKTPKFLHYHPDTLVLTSIEFDHADIYRDLDHVREAFVSLVAGLSPDALLVANTDDPEVRRVVSEAGCRVVTYALEGGAEADWVAGSIRPGSQATRFEVRAPGERAEVSLPLFGAFNVANALAALAATGGLGVPLREGARALAGFSGVKRRQELRFESRGLRVFDDFAHHPTAVAGSLASMRDRFPGERILAVFEPRTNTSRRRIFQQAYAVSLAAADRVIVRRVAPGDLYSATGEVTEFFSSDLLVADLETRGTRASAHDDVDSMVAEIVAVAEPGDVVLVMSNGSFDNLWGRLEEALDTKAE